MMTFNAMDVEKVEMPGCWWCAAGGNRPGEGI